MFCVYKGINTDIVKHYPSASYCWAGKKFDFKKPTNLVVVVIAVSYKHIKEKEDIKENNLVLRDCCWREM